MKRLTLMCVAATGALALVVATAACGAGTSPVTTSGAAAPSAGGTTASASTTSAVPAPGPDAAWKATGVMGFDRNGAAATLLADGRVLVVGGMQNGPGDPVPASSDVYDPVADTWSSAGRTSTGRVAATATLLADGRVLVAGGFTGSTQGYGDTLASAELYDPRTSGWSSTSSMSTPRQGHTATLLADGRVLVAGGADSVFTGATVLMTAELYDPGTGAWTATGSMAGARSGQTATRLRDGRVLVAGGTVPTPGGAWPWSIELATAETYDPGTGRWSPTGGLHAARVDHTATLLPGGTVLVSGGRTPRNAAGGMPSAPYAEQGQTSAEIFDPASGRWTPVGSLHTGRFSHSATPLGDGRVLVAGGTASISGGGDAVSVLRSVEIYDPGSRSWAAGPNLVNARSGHVAVGLRDGAVLVSGGAASPPAVLGAEVYR